MKLNKMITTNKSFTILEVILAIFILTVAVFAAFSLIQQTLIGASLNQSKLAAYYFAQEGLEDVRNIRDTNWLKNQTWNQDISSSEGIVSFLDGAPSRFTREIVVTETMEGYLEVKVVVKWSERGRDHNIEVVNHLYNWY